jgi:hypothetical protein
MPSAYSKMSRLLQTNLIDLRQTEMSPPYVKTIREEILYEYAKLISRSAYETLENGMVPLFKYQT